MPEAARYSLDPCIHFITHLPLSSEICPFFFKYSILLPFFPSSSSLHVSSLALKTFYRNSLNISPLPSPISHLPSPSNLPFYIYIYISNLASPLTPSLLFPSPPQKEIFFPRIRILYYLALHALYLGLLGLSNGTACSTFGCWVEDVRGVCWVCVHVCVCVCFVALCVCACVRVCVNVNVNGGGN